MKQWQRWMMLVFAVVVTIANVAFLGIEFWWGDNALLVLGCVVFDLFLVAYWLRRVRA